MLFSRKILLLPPRKFAILTLKVLPPIRRHVFRDAQCAARLLRDGWCAARRRMKVYSEIPAAEQAACIQGCPMRRQTFIGWLVHRPPAHEGLL